MEVTRELAFKLWKDIFKEELWVTDCFGTWIFRDDYGDFEKSRVRPDGDGKFYSYGWAIDHIRPITDFSNEKDATFLNNLEPMHHNNNLTKSDNCPHFEINGIKYQIVICSICANHNVRGYGIRNEITKERVDWKNRMNRYYKE